MFDTAVSNIQINQTNQSNIDIIIINLFQITGSLSDGLWNASMDTKFQESRDAMRAERFGSSKDHFVAGVKGLGMGLVGGLTSIVTQPIEGAHNSGVSVSALSLVSHVCNLRL